MKTLSSLLLLLCISSVLRETSVAALSAGAATSNITPFLGTSLDGPISKNGTAIQVHDELHARCLVLDDGTTRLAIVVVDSTMVSRPVHDAAKAIIADQSGIPADHVLISATHSHATPRALPGLTDNPFNAAYEEFLARRIADGVERAIGNLAPAKVGWTSFEKPEYVHNRRWFVESDQASGNPFGDTGEKVKMNPGREGLVKPAGPVDPEVFILSVQHAGPGKSGLPLALLANYGTHYIGGYRGRHISADYFGVFSEHIGKLLGAAGQDPPFVGMMSNGTSGDVNANDLSDPPLEKFAPWERMRAVAFDLAGDVQGLYPKIEHHADLSLGMAQRELKFAIRKPSKPRLEWAKQNFIENAEPGQRLTRPQVYARELLALADYPDQIGIIIQAIRIGDLAIASSPCETFAETGLAIKEKSPFPATFTIELANGADGYLPTPQQHEWGGYETWPARSSLLEVNAEPLIRLKIIELLNQLRSP